jgi:glycosyltransferase involved in cell wall biosynthesis
MKVLHLLPSLETGGMETFVLTLSIYQKRAAIDVHLAVFCGSGESARVSVERASSGGIPVTVLERGSTRSVAAKLRDLILKERIDIVHAHNETAVIYAAAASRGVEGLSLVSTIHNGDREKYGVKARLENALAFRRCHAIVAVSEKIAELMWRREFVSKRKLQVIENGIAPMPAVPKERRSELRSSLGIPESSVVIGCIGRLVPVKNHLLFLEAFKIAQSGRSGSPSSSLYFVLAGDGPLRGEIQAKTEALGLEAGVRLLGNRKDIPELLSILDIFALPSLNEGLSISLLEAMAAGKAVLASNRGGNVALVENGVNGLLVDPNDTARMSSAMVELATDTGRRDAMGLRGAEMQNARFGMPVCMERYQALYSSLRGPNATLSP